MILLLTLATLVTLLLPGLAVVHLAARGLDAEKKFVLAPAISLVLYGLAGLAGWLCPHHFWTISRFSVIGLTAIAGLVLIASGGWAVLRRIDPVLPVAYGLLVIVATQVVFLPIKVPNPFPDSRAGTYYVQRDVLPVRIQALYHDLPNDNLVPYRFAQFMLHGVDMRLPREWDSAKRPAIAPGQAVTARTPLMALVGAHYVNLFGPRTPVDGRYGVMGDLLTDEAYIPFFLAACCMNALLMLPAYLIGRELGGRVAARLAVLLLAVNCGMVLETSFIWPKALAGYFAVLLAYFILFKAPRFLTIGALAALTYYSHQCGMAIVIGSCIYYLLTSSRKQHSFWTLVGATVVGIVLTLPWSLWAHNWIHDSGNLVKQNMFQGAELGWRHIVESRLINILRTLVPHAVGSANEPTPGMLFTNCFFTLPGMLGLVLVPFFGAALFDRRLALGSALIGLGSVVITAVTFGQVMGGLTPFGPFLFVPVAMAMAAWSLGRLPRWAAVAVIVLAFAEQAAVLWYGMVFPHRPAYADLSTQNSIRLAALGGMQLAALILSCRCIMGSRGGDDRATQMQSSD